MRLIKPKALKPGDTLGIVATSSPITTSSEKTIERAYQRLRDFGFNVVEAQNCRKTYGHTAGTLQERVNAFHDFFKNPKIDGILAYWGGFQSHQMLEYLDYGLITSHPKALMGFSDSTALQIGIYAKTGLVTFSGPAGISFGKPEFPAFSWQHFQKILMTPEIPWELGISDSFSDNPWYLETDQQMKFQPNTGWKVYRQGTATGQIIGGNIGTLLLLAGTPYWPSMKGCILFLEEDEAETPKTIDRMLTQLRQMGVYDQIKGMVIGRFHRNVPFDEADSLEAILDDALKGYTFPVITGVDFGHTDPMITFPNGILCKITTDLPKIVFLEAGVV